MKKIIISALLAMGFSGLAYAQANSADIILGFKATGGTGSATNLEIDLGSVSLLEAVSGTVTLTNLLSDGANSINSVYGSSWASRSDVLWGTVGAVETGQTGPDGEVSHTLFASSQANSSLLDGNATGTPWNRDGSTASSSTTSKIASLYNNYGVSTQGGVTIGNSFTVSNGTSGSWSAQEGTTNTAFGNGFTPVTQFENSADITGSYVASDLYSLSPSSVAGTPGTFIGTLAIFSNGNVTFSTIPEPSVYAAILGVASLGFVAIRRRKQQILA
jgi:hypothetical protein